MSLTSKINLSKRDDHMILLICFAFFCLGVWLLYLNRLYAGVDPLFHSSFVCFTAAAMLLGGAVTAGGQFALNEGLAIVFPVYLLLLFFIIVIGIPKYTYTEACQIIEQETGERILFIHGKHGHNGQYFCYTKNGCYMFDAKTGDYYIEYDPLTM